MKNKRTIINSLKKKYAASDDKSSNNNPNNLQNDSIAQEIERLRLENKVRLFDFKTEFGELDKNHFDSKFNLKDNTIDYLRQKVNYYETLKLHKFINNIDNQKYLKTETNYLKLFEGFKNAKDSNAFIKENAEDINEAYKTATLVKPLIDVNNFNNSLDGVHSNLSHQPTNTKLIPKASGFIRYEYDPSIDNKVTTKKEDRYWVDGKTPIIVDGVGSVDNV